MKKFDLQLVLAYIFLLCIDVIICGMSLGA